MTDTELNRYASLSAVVARAWQTVDRTVPLQVLNEVGSIGGSVNITGASGLVVIGDPGHGNCAANVISGARIL